MHVQIGFRVIYCEPAPVPRSCGGPFNACPSHIIAQKVKAELHNYPLLQSSGTKRSDIFTVHRSLIKRIGVVKPKLQPIVMPMDLMRKVISY